MYIKVDHSKFEPAATEIDSYVSLMKNQMITANTDISIMSTSWQGSDFLQFKSQWDKVTAGNSTYDKMVKSLESYSKYLRYAAKQYKDAQARAVNRANSLPKY